jgi:hypothetical protein
MECPRNTQIFKGDNQIMDDLDPKSQEVLQLSYEIVQLIEQNVDSFNDEETEEVITSHETISFFLEQDNVERALVEAQSLKKYLIKLTQK